MLFSILFNFFVRNQQIKIPKIYAPNQAKELIEKKLEERNIKYKNLHVYNEKTNLKTK